MRFYSLFCSVAGAVTTVWNPAWKCKGQNKPRIKSSVASVTYQLNRKSTWLTLTCHSALPALVAMATWELRTYGKFQKQTSHAFTIGCHCEKHNAFSCHWALPRPGPGRQAASSPVMLSYPSSRCHSASTQVSLQNSGAKAQLYQRCECRDIIILFCCQLLLLSLPVHISETTLSHRHAYSV